MKISTQTFDLELRHTFTISRGSQDVVQVLVAAVEHEGITGYGETSPTDYYGYSLEGVRKDLENLAPEEGFTIRGTASPAGDVNGDGFADLFVQAPGEGGEAYVVFGSTDLGGGGYVDPATMGGDEAFVVRDAQGSVLEGAKLRSTADVNEDGVTDLIIEAPDPDAE